MQFFDIEEKSTIRGNYTETEIEIFNSFKFFKNYTLEQNANITHFYINLSEFYKYKFSRKSSLIQFKFFKWIRFSVKLRNQYKMMENYPNLNKLETKIILNNSIFFWKKKFLNWWGRVKIIKYYAIPYLKLEILYLYKNLYNVNSFTIFKWWKSLDKKLPHVSLFVFKFSKDFNSIFFFPIVEIAKKNFLPNSFKTNKWPTRLYWSIPRNKLNNSILEIKSLNGILVKENSFKIINLKKLHLLMGGGFFNYKINLINLFTNFRFIKNINLKKKLNFIKNTQIINYLLIFGLQYSFYKNLDFFFMVFFLNLFANNIFEIKKYPTINLYYTNFLKSVWDVKKKFKSKERFTRSYIFKNTLPWKPFRFFQGHTENSNKFEKFFFSRIITPNGISQIYKYYLVTMKANFYPKKNLKKKTTMWWNIFSFFSLKSVLSKNISEEFSKFYIFFDKPIKFLYFNTLISFLPKYLYNNKLKFTLSLPINFSLFFNKFIKLDIQSSFINKIFFYNHSIYNYNFFFKKIIFVIYNKYLSTYFILNNFETFFFKKRLIFLSTAKQITIYRLSFKIFHSSFGNLTKKINKRLKKKLESKLWLDDITLALREELDHLIYQSSHGDLEWSWELVRTKQLSEIWLNKLTSYLKWMHQSKIDVGNIQYSPDFTQQHEFALTLKWGMELEMLRFTWQIILRRFFGKNKYIVRANFIRKKINFLYNFIKTKKKKLNLGTKLMFNSPIKKVLSLKNVYEITRLQLSTIVTTYKNIYKLKALQFDYFHTHFNVNNELTIKDFYNFFFIVFERYFLVNSYKKYYFKTKIKKKLLIVKCYIKKFLIDLFYRFDFIEI